jgi:hypothetical protein
MRLSTRRVAIASATSAGTRAAGTATTQRSAGSGSEARSGTHATPSIPVAPGFTTHTRSAGNPPARTFRRISRPGVAPVSDTPTTAMVRGSKRCRSLVRGRRTGG